MAFDFVAAFAESPLPFITAGDAFVPRLSEAPQQVTLRFTPGVRIDAATIGSGISLVRSVDGSLGDADDRSVMPVGAFGSITVGDWPHENEVVIRFAETLPDDLYRFTITSGLKAVGGDTAAEYRFDVRLDQGAFVTAVVPQPVERAAGGLVQRRNEVHVYFNADDPLDQRSAQNPSHYRLVPIFSETGQGGPAFVPQTVEYSAANARAVLTFDPGQLADGMFYRLEIGPTLVPSGDPTRPAATGDDNSSFATATSLGMLGAGGIAVSAQLDRRSTISTPGGLLTLPNQPGTLDEPGHRDIPANSGAHGLPNLETAPTWPSWVLSRGSDGPVGFYNFRDDYGFDEQGNRLFNTITEAQKQRTREIFEQFSRLMGVRFVEELAEPYIGLTVATGDQRVVLESDTTDPADNGYGVSGQAPRRDDPLFAQSIPVAVVESNQNWGESEYAGMWYRSAMRQIGVALGLKDSYDLPSIMGYGLVDEPVFPGDYDAIHLRQIFPATGTDVDVYSFTVTEPGRLAAETFAGRPGVARSAADTLLTLYREDTVAGATVRTIVARNDDYHGRDSFLGIDLEPGKYFIAVTSTGNDRFQPDVADSGYGGRTHGRYELQLKFAPQSVTSRTLVDTRGTPLDGDRDGRPGGTHAFWFRTASLNETIFVDKLAPAAGATGSLASPFHTIAAAVDHVTGSNKSAPGSSTKIIRIVGNETDGITTVTDGPMAPGARAVRVASTAGIVPGMLVHGAGIAEGASVESVDAVARTVTLSGPALARPAQPVLPGGTPLRFVGVKPYLVGTTLAGRPLADGASFDVPKGVTVMIDAGAVFKLRSAIIDVGSSQQLESTSRANAALQVLGVPGRKVIFTAHQHDSIGGDSDGFGQEPAPQGGQWGGIVFRSDSDDYPANRAFLNAIQQADIRYGGGQVRVDSQMQTFAPVQIESTRPTIVFNTITSSAGAAIAATPNSFEDSNDRIGPEFRGNALDGNSVNGLAIKNSTRFGAPLEQLDVSARFKSTDIVYVFQENLVITGGAGGYTLDAGAGQLLSRPTGRLVIDPGAVVKLQNSRIELERGAGQLIAEGAEFNPVIFTSLGDNRYGAGGTFDTNGNIPNVRAPGDWGGIVLNAGTRASLDQAYVAFGGGLVPIEGMSDFFNVIEVHQGDLRLANTRVEHNAAGLALSDRTGRGTNAAAAVFVRGAQPIIVGNDFRENAGAVVSINANSLSDVGRPDVGRSTGAIARFDDYDANVGPLVSGNVIAYDRNRIPAITAVAGMKIRGEEITVEGVWDDTDIVHVVEDEIVVRNFHTATGLRLQSRPYSSLVVKFRGEKAGLTADGSGLDIEDRIGGTLQIVGQPGHPVILTSLLDDTVGASVDPLGRTVTDTGNDGSSTPVPGDWRSLKFLPLSNDRNVSVYVEGERPLTLGIEDNASVKDAEDLGVLAPNYPKGTNTWESAQEKSGDENRRLGFEVHGIVAFDDPTDVDVYTFQGYAGSEVWIDVDKTTSSLDTMVELLDSAGNVLSRSVDGQTDALLSASLRGAAVDMRRDSWRGGDHYTTNPRDPGMRVVLPGIKGQYLRYYVRVRSQPAVAPGATRESMERDLANAANGATGGRYELRIRLRQRDEKPGSVVRYADIRYPVVGIDVVGLPRSALLAAETGESDAAHIDTNGILGNALDVGNLLAADRNTISVAGTIFDESDVDWYRVELTHAHLRALSSGATWATVFDIDYADGFRGDLTLSVFDHVGALIYIGHDSDVLDDQPASGQGADFDDLARGSIGKLDPFIGTVQLPAGIPLETSITVAGATTFGSRQIALVLLPQEGSLVTGPGIAAGTTVVAIDSATRTITISRPTTAAITAGTKLSFLPSRPSTTVGQTQTATPANASTVEITSVASPNVGAVVAGEGIAVGTLVVGGIVEAAPIRFNGRTAAATPANASTLTIGFAASLNVGDVVTGQGIAAATFVTAVDTTNQVVTISKPTTTAIAANAELTFFRSSSAVTVRQTQAATPTNVSTIPLTNVDALNVGDVVLGLGIAAATTVVSIDTAAQSISISNPTTAAISAGAGLFFHASSALTGRQTQAATPTNASTVTLTDVASLNVGDFVTGQGIAAATTIVAIDTTARIITISKPTTAAIAAGVELSFQSGSSVTIRQTQAATPTNVSTVTLTNVASLNVGDFVTGQGIAAATTIVAIDTTARIITISKPTTAAIAAGVGLSFQSGSSVTIRQTQAATPTNVSTIPLTNVASLNVGDFVTGQGIAAATTIVAIDTTARIITISSPTTAAIAAGTELSFFRSRRFIGLSKPTTAAIAAGTDLAFYRSGLNFQRTKTATLNNVSRLELTSVASLKVGQVVWGAGIAAATTVTDIEIDIKNADDDEDDEYFITLSKPTTAAIAADTDLTFAGGSLPTSSGTYYVAVSSNSRLPAALAATLGVVDYFEKSLTADAATGADEIVIEDATGLEVDMIVHGVGVAPDTRIGSIDVEGNRVGITRALTQDLVAGDRLAFSSETANLTRVEPINSVRRVAEDHIGSTGYLGNGSTRVAPDMGDEPLIDISDVARLDTHVRRFGLGDVTLFVSTEDGLATYDPVTGRRETFILFADSGTSLGDLDMRSDGSLFAYAGVARSATTAGRLFVFDEDAGALRRLFDDGVSDPDLGVDDFPPPNLPQAYRTSSDTVTALAFRRTATADYDDLWFIVRAVHQTRTALQVASGSTVISVEDSSAITPGMTVTGDGFQNGTTVKSLAGNMITLSLPVTRNVPVDRIVTFADHSKLYRADDGGSSSLPDLVDPVAAIDADDRGYRGRVALDRTGDGDFRDEGERPIVTGLQFVEDATGVLGTRGNTLYAVTSDGKFITIEPASAPVSAGEPDYTRDFDAKATLLVDFGEELGRIGDGSAGFTALAAAPRNLYDGSLRGMFFALTDTGRLVLLDARDARTQRLDGDLGLLDDRGTTGGFLTVTGSPAWLLTQGDRTGMSQFIVKPVNDARPVDIEIGDPAFVGFERSTLERGMVVVRVNALPGVTLESPPDDQAIGRLSHPGWESPEEPSSLDGLAFFIEPAVVINDLSLSESNVVSIPDARGLRLEVGMVVFASQPDDDDDDDYPQLGGRDEDGAFIGPWLPYGTLIEQVSDDEIVLTRQATSEGSGITLRFVRPDTVLETTTSNPGDTDLITVPASYAVRTSIVTVSATLEPNKEEQEIVVASTEGLKKGMIVTGTDLPLEGGPSVTIFEVLPDRRLRLKYESADKRVTLQAGQLLSFTDPMPWNLAKGMLVFGGGTDGANPLAGLSSGTRIDDITPDARGGTAELKLSIKTVSEVRSGQLLAFVDGRTFSLPAGTGIEQDLLLLDADGIDGAARTIRPSTFVEGVFETADDTANGTVTIRVSRSAVETRPRGEVPPSPPVLDDSSLRLVKRLARNDTAIANAPDRFPINTTAPGPALVPGMYVVGEGVPPGARILRVEPSSIQLFFENTSENLNGIDGKPISLQFYSDVFGQVQRVSAVDEVRAGMIAIADGLPYNTYVTAVNYDAEQFTLSNPPTRLQADDEIILIPTAHDELDAIALTPAAGGAFDRVRLVNGTARNLRAGWIVLPQDRSVLTYDVPPGTRITRIDYFRNELFLSQIPPFTTGLQTPPRTLQFIEPDYQFTGTWTANDDIVVLDDAYAYPQLHVGMLVMGHGIPHGTTIRAINAPDTPTSGFQIQLSNPATAAYEDGPTEFDQEQLSFFRDGRVISNLGMETGVQSPLGPGMTVTFIGIDTDNDKKDDQRTITTLRQGGQVILDRSLFREVQESTELRFSRPAITVSTTSTSPADGEVIRLAITNDDDVKPGMAVSGIGIALNSRVVETVNKEGFLEVRLNRKLLKVVPAGTPLVFTTVSIGDSITKTVVDKGSGEIVALGSVAGLKPGMRVTGPGVKEKDTFLTFVDQTWIRVGLSTVATDLVNGAELTFSDEGALVVPFEGTTEAASPSNSTEVFLESVDGLSPGMPVGAENISAGTTIKSVNPGRSSITLDRPTIGRLAAGETVSFASRPAVQGDDPKQLKFEGVPVSGLAAGMLVSGLGIPSGTFVESVDESEDRPSSLITLTNSLPENWEGGLLTFVQLQQSFATFIGNLRDTSVIRRLLDAERVFVFGDGVQPETQVRRVLNSTAIEVDRGIVGELDLSDDLAFVAESKLDGPDISRAGTLDGDSTRVTIVGGVSGIRKGMLVFVAEDYPAYRQLAFNTRVEDVNPATGEVTLTKAPLVDLADAPLQFVSTSSAAYLADWGADDFSPVLFAGATGIAFSPLDVNLWHPTDQRRDEPGHGILPASDNSRPAYPGATSMYFGLEALPTSSTSSARFLTYPGQEGQFGVRVADWQRDLTDTVFRRRNTYDLPGGAFGSLTTDPFSLEDYSRTQRPTLSFTYLLHTEVAEGDLADREMRDSARVFISKDGGLTWELIATNNSRRESVGTELPSRPSVSTSVNPNDPRQIVQELLDSASWRQVRIDLGRYAGQADLRLRFDFHTAGQFDPNIADPTGRVVGEAASTGDFSSPERGRRNRFEGFYVDDIIVGLAGRGEMVTGSEPDDDPEFVTVPAPLGAPPQVLHGPYQLEIRRGTEYATVVRDPRGGGDVTVIDVDRLIGIADRLVPSLTDGGHALRGDVNQPREQGQFVIEGNLVHRARDFGISIDAGPRTGPGSIPQPGVAVNYATPNGGRLVPGAFVVNNVIELGPDTAAGIRFAGDAGAGDGPAAVVPHGRLVNNTIYGGATRRGVGVAVADNAGPTLMNNLFASLALGVSVDASSLRDAAGGERTVVTHSAFWNVATTVTGATQRFAVSIAADPFTDGSNRNFYLKPGLPVIDSSLGSLQDRNELLVVNAPLGIPAAPILAPARDAYGQLRWDDPTQTPSVPGLGVATFTDIGAVERVDFSQTPPFLVILDPRDNTAADEERQDDVVEITGAAARSLRRLEFQIFDPGAGIDPRTIVDALGTVLPDRFTITRDGVPLIRDKDFVIRYVESSNRVVFEAASVFKPGIYRIEADRSIKDLAGNSLRPNTNVNAAGTTIFEIRLLTFLPTWLPPLSPPTPATSPATPATSQVPNLAGWHEDKKIHLGWNAPLTSNRPIDRYDLEMSTDNFLTPGVPVGTGLKTTVHSVADDLVNGGRYWFRVRAWIGPKPGDAGPAVQQPWSDILGPIVPQPKPGMRLRADTGSKPTDGITNDGAVEVTGIPVGSSWQYRVGGGDWKYGSATAFTLADGDYEAHSVQVRLIVAGFPGVPTTNHDKWVIDTGDLQAVVIDTVDDDVEPIKGSIPDGGITDDPTPTFKGTAEAEATLRITVGGMTDSTQVDTTGNWSYTPSVPLANGTHRFTFVATDTAGNESPEEEFTLIVDTVAPATPTIARVDDDVAPVTGLVPDGGTTDDRTPRLSGSAVSGLVVRIYEGTTLLGVATRSGTTWDFQVPSPLIEGTRQFTARTISPAGGESAPSAPYRITIDTTPPAPAITGVLDDVPPMAGGQVPDGGVTNDRAPTFTGTAQVGTTVELYRNGLLFDTVPAFGGTAWSYTPGSGKHLADGRHEFTARSRSATGRLGPASAVRTFTVDTSASGIRRIEAVTPSGSYGIGQWIDFQVTFDEPVAVGGTPLLQLNTTPQRSAGYVTGSGTTTLVFRYQIQVGDRVPQLDYASAAALGGATFADLAGNQLDATLPEPGDFLGKTIAIDALIKAIAFGLSQWPADPPDFAAPPTVIQVEFNVPVTGVSPGSIRIERLSDPGDPTSGRPVTLRSVRTSGSGTSYTIELLGDENPTSLPGRYKLVIGGLLSGIRVGDAVMDVPSEWYFDRPG